MQDGASIVHSFIEEVKKSPHRPLILCPLSLSLSQSLYISVYLREVEIEVVHPLIEKVKNGDSILHSFNEKVKRLNICPLFTFSMKEWRMEAPL